MNETSTRNKWITEELPPNVCQMCLKLVTEDRKKGLKPPEHLQCLYGHTLAGDDAMAARELERAYQASIAGAGNGGAAATTYGYPQVVG